MSRALDIYKNVEREMNDAEEIEGVEGVAYLRLMLEIQHTAQTRFNTYLLRLIEEKIS
jgi:hypothetical protein